MILGFSSVDAPLVRTHIVRSSHSAGKRKNIMQRVYARRYNSNESGTGNIDSTIK